MLSDTREIIMLKTVPTSPVDLVIGDRVYHYGAIVEVVHINVSTHPSHCENGPVHACISRLVGDDTGSIPRGWFETPESMVSIGSAWAKDLPPGRYWNVQGNRLACCNKIVD